MAKVSRETLEKLAGLSDDDRADLLALFDGVKEKDTEIENLRKKMPTDSQTVVETVDFKKLQDTAKEREDLITKLKGRLAELDVKKEEIETDPLAAFGPIAGLIS